MTKAEELRELLDEELEARLKETKEELLKLRFAIASGQGTETSQLGALRKEIARIETVRAERRAKERGARSRGGRK
jgi:large subunit ribosomal protein L29